MTPAAHPKPCKCDPPCVLQRIHKATKADLRDWLVNALEELDMANAYIADIRAAVRGELSHV